MVGDINNVLNLVTHLISGILRLSGVGPQAWWLEVLNAVTVYQVALLCLQLPIPPGDPSPVTSAFPFPSACGPLCSYDQPVLFLLCGAFLSALPHHPVPGVTPLASPSVVSPSHEFGGYS